MGMFYSLMWAAEAASTGEGPARYFRVDRMSMISIEYAACRIPIWMVYIFYCFLEDVEGIVPFFFLLDMEIRTFQFIFILLNPSLTQCYLPRAF